MTDVRLALRARDAALAIGERLLRELDQPDYYDENHERYATQQLGGTLGYALFFLALTLATGETRFEAAMHEQLKRAVRTPSAPIGLTNGLSGLRAVAALAVGLEPRYAKLVAQCDHAIGAASSISPPSTYMDYDVMSGWSGQRIARCIDGVAPADRTAIALIELLDRRQWFVPHPWRQDERREHCLGLAHGLPGVLTALATTVEHIDEKLRRLLDGAANELMVHARTYAGVSAWPRILEEPEDTPCRAVWCFGAPGVAASLLAVSQAIGNAAVERFAIETLVEVCALSSEAMLVAEEGLCHGSMGNALVYFAAALRTGDARLTAACDRFTLETVEALERNGHRCVTRGIDGVVYDALGYANGIAGIGLGLLTVCGAYDAKWLRLRALGDGR